MFYLGILSMAMMSVCLPLISSIALVSPLVSTNSNRETMCANSFISVTSIAHHLQVSVSSWLLTNPTHTCPETVLSTSTASALSSKDIANKQIFILLPPFACRCMACSDNVVLPLPRSSSAHWLSHKLEGGAKAARSVALTFFW